MGTDTGVKPWAQTRNETAGENLQNDAVLMMRPRGNVFIDNSPDGGMRAVMDRTPKINPGRIPLAAVPPGVRGTLPRSDVEAVPYGGCCADP